jgi:hypothetical protein
MSRIRSVSENLKLLRPVLYFSKGYLKNFLIHKNIEWKNDPMNDDVIFKRVVFRKKIQGYSQEKLLEYFNEIKRLGKIRREVELEALRFLKENSDIKKNILGYAMLDCQKFMCEKTKVQKEILKRIIWNIGGKKYATVIDDEILEKIISRKINTIGRCFIKINKKTISFFREKRNLGKLVLIKQHKFSISHVLDDRFLITIENKIREFSNNLAKCMISYYEESREQKNSNSSMYARLQDNIADVHSSGLPCVYQNNKIVFVHGIGCFSADIAVHCNFMHKVNLFDVFL